MKRILLTGAAGYIGSTVAEQLLEHGFAVTGIDNLSTGRVDFLPNGIDFIKGDVRDLDLMMQIASNCDMLVHTAGLKFAGESVKDPSSFYESNTIGTLRSAQAARATKMNSILFSSSCSVYGNLKGVVATEDLPSKPVSPYGRSKNAGEEILQDFNTAYGTHFVSLRYFNVVGASKNGSYDFSDHNLFPNIVRAIKDNSIFEVYGREYPTSDGTCVRDYVDVNDIARAHLLAVLEMSESREKPGHVNLGSGRGYSVLEIIKEFEKASNLKIQRDFLLPRPGDPAEIVSSFDLAASRWNWAPTTSITESVESQLKESLNSI